LKDLDCLDGLVGLTDIDCPCITADRPPNYNESSSGYFLTDMEYGFPLEAAVFTVDDCFNGKNVWELMQKALDDAIRDFKVDLRSTLYNKFDSKYQVFSGVIGKKKQNGTEGSDAVEVNLKITPRDIRSGCWILKKICLGVSCDATIEVNIFSSENPDTAIETFTVNTQANEFVEHVFTQPLELPLHSDNCDDLQYIFKYELTPDCKPLNNKLICCSDKHEWKTYVAAKGCYLTQNGKEKTSSKWAYGLSLEGYFSCDNMAWICELGEVNDFHVLDVIARHIQFRAISKLMAAVLSSGKINFFTLLSDKVVMDKKNSLKKHYDNHIAWIVENLPDNGMDCFKCKKNKVGKKKSLLV